MAEGQRPQVVRLVVAGREHVRAEHDPTPDLSAEPNPPALPVHAVEIVRSGSHPVPERVEPGQVARGLRGRDDVVAGDRRFGHRQRDAPHVGARIGDRIQDGSELRPDRGVESVTHILLWYSDPGAGQ